MIVSYEGVNFNAEWAAKKTEAEFLKHESHHGLTEEQLKEAYKLSIAAVKPQAAVKPATVVNLTEKPTDKPASGTV